MKSKDLFGLGTFISMCASAILYLENGHSFFHYTSIIYFLIFIGIVMTTKAFSDANVGDSE